MKRHPFAIARDQWRDRPAYQKLIAGQATGQYLRNRLDVAFEEGWKAAEACIDAALKTPRDDQEGK